MLIDCKTVNDTNKQQVATKTQSENWITTDEIREKYEKYLANINLMF